MEPSLEKFLRNFADLAEAASEARRVEHTGEQLWDVLEAHLGADAGELPIVVEEFGGHRMADASLLLSAAAAGDRVVGLGGQERHHMGLADLLQNRRYQAVPIAEPGYRTEAVGPDENRRIIDFGLFLLGAEHGPLAVLLRGPAAEYGRAKASLEIVGTRPERVDDFTAWFRQRLRQESIYRGHVVSFTGNEYESTTAGVTFHRRPGIDAGSVVLPSGVLERVERHVVGMGRHREALLAAGQHLKRGVLLYGPPGTGKTHTVRYLLSRTAGTTAILLSAGSLALVAEAARMARALQPAILVLEDCDLVAEDRSFGHGPQPLLFEVLEAMDGLDADADVAFVLTTNRVDQLERALAQRPGRVDLAVEIPRPGLRERRQLLELYAAGQGFGARALARAARDTAGTTASFTKELVRRAVLAAVLQDRPVRDGDLREAVGELMAAGAELTRNLLGSDGFDHESGGMPDAEPDEPDGGGGVPFGTMGWAPQAGSYFAHAPGTGFAEPGLAPLGRNPASGGGWDEDPGMPLDPDDPATRAHPQRFTHHDGDGGGDGGRADADGHQDGHQDEGNDAGGDGTGRDND